VSNYGKLHGRTNVLPIVIGITVVLSMFPASLLGWTSDLADLVRIPVTPISHIGMMFTNWIRPAVDPSDLPTDEKDRNEFTVSEWDRYRQMYHDQTLRANDLANQLRMLQKLPESELRNPNPPLMMSIALTGLRSSDVAGIVELKLVRGASTRILEGDVAVVGRDIVGRISRVTLTRIELRSTTHKETGLIRAAIVTPHPVKDIQQTILGEVLLRNAGNGSFTAEALATSEIKIDDLVVLDDPAWPVSGRGYILGSVIDITQLDEAPLRQLLIIAPRRRVRDVSRVVVLGTGVAPTP